MEEDMTFPGSLGIKDPFQYLEDDHRKVEDFFEKLDGGEEDAERDKQEIFVQLQEALSLHAELEEACVYPVLEEKEETRALAKEGESEHGKIKELLAQLAQLSPEDDEWEDTVLELQECVEHHVEEEESDLFPKARTELSETEKEKLAASMTAFLQEVT